MKHNIHQFGVKFNGVNPIGTSISLVSKNETSPVKFSSAFEEIAPPSDEFYISGKTTKKTLKLRAWRPFGVAKETLPKEAPVVLLVHSLGGRTRWMTPLIKRLMKEQPGFRFYGLDIPYVGQHDYGLGHVKDGRQLVQHVQDATSYVADKHRREVYTVGLSLGGLLVTMAAAEPNSQLAGTVAMSPGYLPSGKIVNAKVITKSAWRSFKGLFSSKPEGIGFSMGLSGRPKSDQVSEVDKKRSELQKLIRQEKDETNDKVAGLTTRSYVRLFKLMSRLFVKDAKKVEVPYRLYLSEADDIVSVKWAEKKIFPKIKSKDKGMIVYQDSDHDFNTHPDIDHVALSINHFLSQQHAKYKNNQPK